MCCDGSVLRIVTFVLRSVNLFTQRRLLTLRDFCFTQRTFLSRSVEVGDIYDES